jgi:hypothetical protein
MRLVGRSGRERSSEKQVALRAYHAHGGQRAEMYDTLHLPVRLVPRLRETSPQPPSFRQRIATAQGRDECLFSFLPNNSSTFVTTYSC